MTDQGSKHGRVQWAEWPGIRPISLAPALLLICRGGLQLYMAGSAAAASSCLGSAKYLARSASSGGSATPLLLHWQHLHGRQHCVQGMLHLSPAPLSILRAISSRSSRSTALEVSAPLSCSGGSEGAGRGRLKVLCCMGKGAPAS